MAVPKSRFHAVKACPRGEAFCGSYKRGGGCCGEVAAVKIIYEPDGKPHYHCADHYEKDLCPGEPTLDDIRAKPDEWHEPDATAVCPDEDMC